MVIHDEPRWPSITAVVMVATLHGFLPSRLTAGPGWLPVVMVVILSGFLVWSHYSRKPALNQLLGYMICGIITAALAYSLGALVAGLPHRLEEAPVLLRSAGILWTTNVIIFATWYWRLDGGGPHGRSQKQFHQEGAFLFPQMTLDAEARAAAGIHSWRPHFVDYLFLSFNTSTAFSPTDVPVLSRWAKLLMMIQASISLTTLAIVAARAVNVI